MDHCLHCHSELPTNASFCGKCGLSLHNKSRQTEEVLSIQCPHCHGELPTSASFCGKCGLSLHNKSRQTEEVLSMRLSGQSSTMTMPDNLTDKRSMVVKMNDQIQGTRNKRPGFWISISLMMCLNVGLAAYIVSTYLSNPASSTTRISSVGGSAQPTLSLQAPQSATIKQGQTLILHGEQFRSNDPISFLLDFTLPIKDKNNQTISVRASSKGSFDVSIPIQGSDWSANTHSIDGVDNLTRQNAYLTVIVSPASAPVATSQNLALSLQGKPVTALTFQAVARQGNPAQQRVTLTNISGSPLSWTATASADHDLNWLVIDDNHLAGNLGIGDTDSIGISALITALTSSHYTGQIVFTINGQEQLTLPVELQVVDAQPEMVFTPNPAVATLGPGNTCTPTTFTLINFGHTFLHWTLVPHDSATTNHLQFIANGQPMTQGDLASSGTPGDTQVLNLQCNSVLAGESYQFTVYAANTSWPVTITIQA